MPDSSSAMRVSPQTPVNTRLEALLISALFAEYADTAREALNSDLMTSEMKTALRYADESLSIVSEQFACLAKGEV